MRESTLRKIIREELEAIKAKELPELLTPEDVSSVLHINLGTLANWRSKGIGPGYRKIGGLALYEKTVVAEYIAAS